MKSMMRRTTLREVKQSFGRFFAILAIIALGVGFYAGLTVTKSAMVQTTDHYLKDQAFFDYRLLSTLGFEKADVEALAEEENVAAAEGSFFLDVLSEDEEVVRLHSITQELNLLKVTEGRMPETSAECVVDAKVYPEGVIGSKLILSENNDPDTLDQLTAREFTIVGRVQSPYYMNFERGTTSIGNGKVSCFAYLPADSFDMDYYMEIFVRFDQQAQIYSEEYLDYLEEKEALWEELCEERAALRYESVLAEATEELEDARNELETRKADAQAELDDALADLQDAETQIEDSEAQIKDGEKQLEDGEKTLAEQEKQLQDNLALLALQFGEENIPQEVLLQTSQAQEQIDSARKNLEQKQKELEEAKEELEEARRELEDGWQEYTDAQADFEKEIGDAEEKLADAQEEVDSIEAPDTYVLGRDTNLGYACFENDSDIVAGIARVFPVFFFLVAALVCITTMNRMVEEQRTQIGVLKALGYGKAAIMGKYMFYSGSAALIGCVSGFFLGTYGFPRVIWTAYGIMYQLVPLEYVFNGGLFVISIMVALLCSVGTTWFSCRYELEEVAAQLMRPKSPKAGKRVFLEKIPFVWRRMKFLHKVSARNIFRYKKRFFMMILGISGCTALLVTGFGIKDSISNIAAFQYEEIMIFDGTVNFTDPQGGELKKDFAKVADILYTAEKSMDVYGKGSVKSVNLVVAGEEEKLTEFVDFHTDGKEPVALPKDGEALINTKLADVYNIRVGDEILLRDEEMREMRVRVSGIFENYIYNYVYINENTYRSQMKEEPEYKSAYVKFEEGGDVHECAASLMDEDGVASVSVNEDMRERIGSMMSSLDYIVVTVIICAAVLAFIVLYNLTNINITERIREIATIKVLGFYKKETANYVFRENMVLTGLGALLGLFLGRMLHAFVMGQINIDMIAFAVRVKGISYVYSIFLTFLFAWSVNLVMSVKIDRINMAESLKSVD